MMWVYDLGIQSRKLKIYVKTENWEQDGGGVRGPTHLLPQTHQKKKNTFTCKRTHTEYQLNAGRRT